MVSLGSSLAPEGICLFDLCSLVSETQNEIVVELPCEGWWKYIDLTLAYILDHAVCCVCQKFGPKLSSHYKPVKNEIKFGLSEPHLEN